MSKKHFKLITQYLVAALLWPIVLPGAGIYYIHKSKQMGIAKNSPLVFTLVVAAILLSNWWFPILFNQPNPNQNLPSVLAEDNSPVNQLDSFKQAKVERVIDGDTIIVKMGEQQTRVRLLGINAPELGEAEQCYGSQASQRLGELINGKDVQLVRDPTQDEFDRYGRLLAYVVLPDGLNVNLQMVREGAAREYTYDTEYKFQAEVIQAQTESRAEKLGLWGDSCKCEKRELGRVCSGCNKQRVTYQEWSCQQVSKVENALSGQCNCSGV